VWLKIGLLGGFFALVAGLWAGLDGSYTVPLEDPAIEYATRPVSDPVARLQERLNRKETRLRFDPEWGYLPAVLETLGVPVSSQMLVFSKTSFQAPRISTRWPRAIYFNDQVSIGWVRYGDVLEVASIDPQQGAIFYTLEQVKSSFPKFVRRDGDCLQCHALGSTLGVPGLLVRSVYTDNTAQAVLQRGSFITDHRSPLKERWGGWYVTGTHGAQRHMGNTTIDSEEDGQNLKKLTWLVDTASYMTPHSDIVALMTLEHQARMQNMITRVNYEARMAMYAQAGIDELNRSLNLPLEITESTRRRINNAAEAIVGYMLFTDETPLTDRVEGVSGFAEEFSKLGPADSKGRSLRQFDLKRRMFRYPSSYMIYSEAFDAIPEPMKERIYRRLWEVLSGEDQSPAYAKLSAEDRRAILEILRETKKGLPEYWSAARR
jgi:hypothetical protein